MTRASTRHWCMTTPFTVATRVWWLPGSVTRITKGCRPRRTRSCAPHASQLHAISLIRRTPDPDVVVAPMCHHDRTTRSRSVEEHICCESPSTRGRGRNIHRPGSSSCQRERRSSSAGECEQEPLGNAADASRKRVGPPSHPSRSTAGRPGWMSADAPAKATSLPASSVTRKAAERAREQFAAYRLLPRVSHHLASQAGHAM